MNGAIGNGYVPYWEFTKKERKSIAAFEEDEA